MALNRRVTGALAWTGMALIVGVPAIDMLRPKDNETLAVQAPASASVSAPVLAIDPIVTAKPVTPRKLKLADPVGAYTASGAPMPAYISETPLQADGAVKTTAPAATTSVAITKGAPVEVQTGTAAITPTPAGAEMNPANAETAIASVTPETGATSEIVAPIPRPASARPKLQVLAKAIPPSAATVTATSADLSGWKSGTLDDYLRRNNLITPDNGGNGAAAVTSTGPDKLPPRDTYYLPVNAGY